MRVSIFQIVLAIALSALLGAFFAIASNFVSGAHLIGFSVTSALTIGAIFAAVGALFIKIGSSLSRKSSKLFFLGSGITYGALIYLLNVYFGFNAGFSLFGLVLISGFGLMSGIGSLVSHGICSAFDRLNQLT